MKATKLLGSVALTAALAMGAVPAFAAQNAPSDWQPGVDQGIGGAGVSNTNKMVNVTTDANNVKTGTGATAVKASVFDADMQVTIPLQLSVAFASVGSTLTCPTEGAYQIINNGDDPVKITHIATTPTGFELVDLDTATTDLGENAPVFANGHNGNKGIAMVLDFGGANKIDLKKANDSVGADMVRGNLDRYGGQVKAIEVPANGKVSANISGATTQFQTAISVGYQTNTILNIQYTIGTTSATS